MSAAGGHWAPGREGPSLTPLPPPHCSLLHGDAGFQGWSWTSERARRALRSPLPPSPTLFLQLFLLSSNSSPWATPGLALASHTVPDEQPNTHGLGLLVRLGPARPLDLRGDSLDLETDTSVPALRTPRLHAQVKALLRLPKLHGHLPRACPPSASRGPRPGLLPAPWSPTAAPSNGPA